MTSPVSDALSRSTPCELHADFLKHSQETTGTKRSPQSSPKALPRAYQMIRSESAEDRRSLSRKTKFTAAAAIAGTAGLAALIQTSANGGADLLPSAFSSRAKASPSGPAEVCNDGSFECAKQKFCDQYLDFDWVQNVGEGLTFIPQDEPMVLKMNCVRSFDAAPEVRTPQMEQAQRPDAIINDPTGVQIKFVYPRGISNKRFDYTNLGLLIDKKNNRIFEVDHSLVRRKDKSSSEEKGLQGSNFLSEKNFIQSAIEGVCSSVKNLNCFKPRPQKDA